MSASPWKTTRARRWRRASWCSRRSSPARRSRAPTAANTDAPRRSRGDGRTRISLVAARPDATQTRRVTVRRAESGDLATVVSLRLALLREYGDHPLYGELAPDVLDRAFDLYHSQIVAADER